MIKPPALTAERIEALNTVNLQLLGVDHGIIVPPHQLTEVEGITDANYAVLSDAIQDLNPARGDVLAIEPAGFQKDQADYPTVEEITFFTVPKGPCNEMTAEQLDRLDGYLTFARNTRRINPFVYGAAHALMKGVPVHRAEASRRDFRDKFGDPEPGMRLEDDPRREEKLAYRSDAMLACLGDVAVGMVDSRQIRGADDTESPVLLAVHSPVNTLRLAGLLHQGEVAFSAHVESRRAS